LSERNGSAETVPTDGFPAASPSPATSIARNDAARVEVRTRTERVPAGHGSAVEIHVFVDLVPHGPPLIDPSTGPVAHLIFAIDVSATMNRPDRFPAVARSLRRALRDLARPAAPPSLVSLIVFAGRAKTLLRGVPARHVDASEIVRALATSPLMFTPGADVAGALRRAGKIACGQLRARRAMPVRVCLVTDGRPQDVARTSRIMTRIRSLPVDVRALTFGDDADVAYLRDLVAGGRGGTAEGMRPDTVDAALRAAARVPLGALSNRAILQFELARGVEGVDAWRRYPGRHRFGDGAFVCDSTFRCDLGMLESDQTYSLRFILRVADSSADATRLGRLSLRLRGTVGPRIFEREVSTGDGGVRAAPAAARGGIDAPETHDVETRLMALRVRRRLYRTEGRDPDVIGVIGKAIAALETAGSLAGLSVSECETLRVHARGTASPRRSDPRAKVVGERSD
jgi:hypothetical protein